MIIIDYKDRRPIYEQIVERFQMLIVKGILEPDSQMPSVRKLATDLAINPNTIQKAYMILEQNGFIYPVKGRGNFVTGGEKLVRQKQEAFLTEFREQARQAKELGIEADALQEEIRQVYAGHPAEAGRGQAEVKRPAEAGHGQTDDSHPAEAGREQAEVKRPAETGHGQTDDSHPAEAGRGQADENCPAQTGQEGRNKHDSD